MRSAFLLLLLSSAGADPDGLGTNLEALSDWSTSRPFADPFKVSRPWISGSEGQWSDGRALSLDRDGWVTSLLPGQIARTLLFWDMAGHFPAGEYRVSYRGSGRLSYFGGAQLQSSQPGLDVVLVDPRQGGIGINLTATDARDPLRSIEIAQPAAVAIDGYFIREFIESLQPYRVLRFMDWQATNGSVLQHWGQRPLLSDARWTDRGAPLETMVALANTCGADPWFCMPHGADDTFVEKFSRLVASKLDPRRKVYVEYSNEVWNSQFQQSAYAESQGLKLRLSSNRYEAQLSFYALRAAQVMAIWERALPPERLVRVLGSQAANPWVTDTEIQAAGARQHFDAIAIAPYFGGFTGDPQQRARFSKMSLDALFLELKRTALPEADGWMRAQKAACDKHRLPLIAYEAGQSLVGYNGAENDAALNALFDAANRDPRMGQLYTDYLAGWQAGGGKLLCHYNHCGVPSKWGRWGAISWLGQSPAESPKYAALRNFAR